MDMSEYMEAFKTESDEHLQQLNESLLELEQDAGNMEHINMMFRSAHTLKGMAATVGFTTIAELTHEMENLMDRIRNHEAELDDVAIDVLFESLDTLEALVESIETGEEVDISHLREGLRNMSKGGSVAKPLTMETKNLPETEVPAKGFTEGKSPELDINFSDDDKEAIENIYNEGSSVMVSKVILDESCVLKAARSTLVMRNISEIGDIIKTVPHINDLEDEKFDLGFMVIFSTDRDDATVKKKIENVSEVKDVTLSPLFCKSGTDNTSESIEKTEINVENKTKEEAGSAIKRKQAIKSVQSVRVRIEQLDNLMNLVGELLINKVRLNQLTSDLKTKELNEALTSLDRLTNDIQTEVMEARMVPIGQIFSRFPRMVRDLSKSEEKQVNLIIEGKEIELDRTVLDEIGDPLVHLLRNAVDHGIEEKEDRQKAGKPPVAVIRLAASRQHNNVVIEVEDDGKGMKPEELRTIAFNKGLMSQADAEKLSDSEALQIIFTPGFSGAKKVTDVSGRGVGMDVVKTKIETLGGTVKLESKEGKGSKIQLNLPLTVAIIQSLMVKVADETYAIPLANVVRDVGVKASDIKTMEGEEIILLRGEVLPLLRLHSVLQSPVPEEDKENLIVVVVEKMGNNVGLVVDELIGQQEVIIKTLDSKLLKNTKGFAGATILGDGRVALILDIATLI